MDNISTLGLDDAANGFAVFDEPYRERASSELSGLPSHTIIFSYGPPDMVRQAKLEALEMKVRRKMQEQKASVRDTHALSDFTAADMPSTAVRVSARANGVGSLGLVKSLVVPPELTEHGEEVRGSSHFILDGERLEYQRPARIARSGSQVARPMPQYRMYEPGQRTSVSGNQKKKQQPQQQLQQQQQQKSLGGRGAAAAAATESAGMTRPTGKAAAAAAAAAGGGAAAAAAGQRRSSLTGPHLAGQGPAAASASASGGGGGSGGVSGGWVGGAEARAHSLRSELKVQLSDGMLAYVPSKFERPKNVERTAFVPQGQAIEEARHKYESVKRRRPASAPLRRSGGGAAASASAAQKSNEAGDVNAGASSGGGGSGGGPGGGTWGGSSAARDRKWLGVSVAYAEETDLLAMYRQQSQQQQQQQQERQQQEGQQGPGGLSRSASAKLRGASVRSIPPAVAAATQPQFASARGAVPADRKAVSITASAVGGGIRTAPRTAAASATAAVKTAWAAGDSPSHTRGKPVAAAAPAAASKQRPVAPANAVEAAAMAAAAAGLPWSANRGAAWPWEGPRPRSPPRSPPSRTNSRVTAAARTPVSSRPPSQRRIAVPLTETGGGFGVSGGGIGGGGSAAAGVATREGMQPLSPETRRQRQGRPGSAISTAKTNRVRGTVSVDASSAAQPVWSSSSATAPPPCDRTQLQERILDGLVRQYTLGPDDDGDDGDVGPSAAAAAANAAADVADTTAAGQRRPLVRQKRATIDAASSGFSFSGGGGGGGGMLAAQRSAMLGHWGSVNGDQQQRQPYQPPAPAPPSSSQPQRTPRPHSAPNRRLRPPSPGHWAGRPDPDTITARTSILLQHSTTGIVYDPELQPSPVDLRINQLEGLD